LPEIVGVEVRITPVPERIIGGFYENLRKKSLSGPADGNALKPCVTYYETIFGKLYLRHFISLEQSFGMIVCSDETVGIDAVPGSCPDANFAAFSPDLVEPCIMAGGPTCGVVLDPFAGSGRTAMFAHKDDRKCIGIDLNKTHLGGSPSRVLKRPWYN